jgi:hypothetical protein
VVEVAPHVLGHERIERAYSRARHHLALDQAGDGWARSDLARERDAVRQHTQVSAVRVREVTELDLWMFFGLRRAQSNPAA